MQNLKNRLKKYVKLGLYGAFHAQSMVPPESRHKVEHESCISFYVFIHRVPDRDFDLLTSLVYSKVPEIVSIRQSLLDSGYFIWKEKADYDE